MKTNHKTFTTPYNDVIFKAIFGKEGDKSPLMSLLSSIMDLPLESFEDLILINTELMPGSIEQKVSRLDLRIKLKDQTEIDVEVQVIELSKLNAYNRTIENDLLIDWAEFLSLNSEDELMNFKDRTDLPEDVLKAIEEYERLKDDPNLQMEALSKQIAIMDYMQGLLDAENRGEEKGDRLAKYEIVKNMKALGLSADIIAQATGLDLDTIEKL